MGDEIAVGGRALRVEALDGLRAWRGGASLLARGCLEREYGDVVPVRLGPARMVLLSHPDLVEQVLVTQHANFDKGEGHGLTRSPLRNGLLTSEGDERDVHHEMLRLTLQIVAKTLVDANVASGPGESDAFGDALSRAVALRRP